MGVKYGLNFKTESLRDPIGGIEKSSSFKMDGFFVNSSCVRGCLHVFGEISQDVVSG